MKLGTNPHGPKPGKKKLKIKPGTYSMVGVVRPPHHPPPHGPPQSRSLQIRISNGDGGFSPTSLALSSLANQKGKVGKLTTYDNLNAITGIARCNCNANRHIEVEFPEHFFSGDFSSQTEFDAWAQDSADQYAAAMLDCTLEITFSLDNIVPTNYADQLNAVVAVKKTTSGEEIGTCEAIYHPSHPTPSFDDAAFTLEDGCSYSYRVDYYYGNNQTPNPIDWTSFTPSEANHKIQVAPH